MLCRLAWELLVREAHFLAVVILMTRIAAAALLHAVGFYPPLLGNVPSKSARHVNTSYFDRFQLRTPRSVLSWRWRGLRKNKWDNSEKEKKWSLAFGSLKYRQELMGIFAQSRGCCTFLFFLFLFKWCVFVVHMTLVWVCTVIVSYTKEEVTCLHQCISTPWDFESIVVLLGSWLIVPPRYVRYLWVDQTYWQPPLESLVVLYLFRV